LRRRIEPIVTLPEEPTLLSTPISTSLGVAAVGLTYGWKETLAAAVTANPTSAVSNSPTVTGDLKLASGTLNGTATVTGTGTVYAQANGAMIDNQAAGNGFVILSGSVSGNFGGSGSELGAVQLSGFIGTGSGAALDFPHSVSQWSGDLHGVFTNAGALAIPGNSFSSRFLRRRRSSWFFSPVVGVA